MLKLWPFFAFLLADEDDDDDDGEMFRGRRFLSGVFFLNVRLAISVLSNLTLLFVVLGRAGVAVIWPS